MSVVGDIATKEDRPPYIRFERKPIEDALASRAAGHYIAKDVDFVYITPAYTRDVMIHKVADWFPQLEKKARDGRFKAEWLQAYKRQYDAWKNGQELPLEGMPIRGWGVISPALQDTLCRMNILTVEDAAAMNDDAIRRIGMGGADVKNKAIAALKATKDVGPVVMENAELKKKLTLAEANVETLTERVNQLARMVENFQPRMDTFHVEPAAAPAPTISVADIIEEPQPAHQEAPAYETDASIAARYEAKFGQPPHHRMKRETILAKLEE